MTDTQHEARLARARLSLDGLSVADSFGGFFEGGNWRMLTRLYETKSLPPVPWRFTDDTNMALSIYVILRDHHAINQDALAQHFAEHYHPLRGYGAAMHGLLAKIRDGMPWREVAGNLFNGQGSFGNGSAMRVAPVGGYFADDLDAAVENARLSAEVTHAHPEAVAGAIAVAVAAAYAWRAQQHETRPTRREFIEQVIAHTPESEVKSGLHRARDLSPQTQVEHAAEMLGSGYRVTAMDTVPFVVWCAGEYLDDYETAIWQTALGLGDVDTTCAMVGGIVALYTGADGIPDEWLNAREPLPEWAVGDAK